MIREAHWNDVYRHNGPDDVSWHQAQPQLSLDLIAATRSTPDAGIIDVGGGASVLCDRLLDKGYSKVGVLDISSAALAHARKRLGARAVRVEWFEKDVTLFEPPHRFGIWHDRAVFHFLTQAEDRQAYLSVLRKTLETGGHVIIATFAADGPPRCSGLPVRDLMKHRLLPN